MELNKYNIYVGTARGCILYNADKQNTIKFSKAVEPSEITALAFGPNENEIITGFENGMVDVYNTLDNEFIKNIKTLKGEGPVVGIGCANNIVVIGMSDGIINLWNDKKNDFFDINLDEKGTLNRLEVHKNRNNIIGTGGEFNDFKLWDIETQQCVFKAKSLGHDNLNLPIPTSIRGITFFPENEHLSACATKEGHVLLYDDRAQRRPAVKFLETKASYTSIACAYRERQCLVGSTRGYMQLLDMKMGKSLKTFTTFTGSVTDIICDPIEPYVISTSLDRYLRVHNLETKELLHKIYMKQNLNRIVLKPVVKDEPNDEEELTKENVDEEYEDLFNNMEMVSSDFKIKKGKRSIEKVEEIIVESKKVRKNNKKKKIKKSES